MQKYKTLATLGDGAFGTVYKATNIKTGQIVAIKKMKQKYTNWNQCVQLREIKSLRKFNHHNIMKLKEVLLVAEELYMVFQYLENNLYEVYAKMKEKGKKFTEGEIKSMVYQIASGLAHMHKIGFFHRDLKPQNLLIYNNIVKICDFGLAREIRSRPPFTDYVSTRWYRAPQLLLRSTAYNSPVDIFALGCIMAEFYTQAPLFPGTNQVDQMNKIVKILGTPGKGDWPEGYKMSQTKNYYFPEEAGISLGELIPDACPQAIDLIQQMLQYSSRKRPTAQDILKHQFFKGISLPEPQTEEKDVVFAAQPNGIKLNTSKQDKNIDVFRVTKEKFKQIRKHDAGENDPYKQYENLRISHLIDKAEKEKHKDKNKDEENKMEDLDSLIKQLEQKEKKKSKVQKLPLVSSMPHFPLKQWTKPNSDNPSYSNTHTINYKPQKRQKDQSLFQIGNKLTNREVYLEKYIKTQQTSLRLKQELIKKCNSPIERNSRNGRNQGNCGKFAYSFQPAIGNNSNGALCLPGIRGMQKLPNLGVNGVSSVLALPSLNKQKGVSSTSNYKY